jgi:hypothetical protein
VLPALPGLGRPMMVHRGTTARDLTRDQPAGLGLPTRIVAAGECAGSTVVALRPVTMPAYAHDQRRNRPGGLVTSRRRNSWSHPGCARPPASCRRQPRRPGASGGADLAGAHSARRIGRYPVGI